MPETASLHSLFLITLVAALTPLVLARMPHPRLPEVVVLIVAGIVIGPHALGWAHPDVSIDLVSNIGLGMLFFLAGFELDRALVTGRSGRVAMVAWGISICVSMAVVGALDESGYVRAFVPISIALTTTALGTLVPILRDAGESRLPLGRAVLANGAIGEMLPVIGISLFLTSRGIWAAVGLLAAFGVAAFVLAQIVTRLRERRIATLIRSGSDTSSQTMVRFSVLLLIALLAVAARFGLDVVLGAFAAGIVLRVALPEGDEPLELKLDGLGYGFFIPAFFVVSGMTLDIGSILRDPTRTLVFFALILLVRGLPVIPLFWRWLPGIDAIRLALYTATGLPLIVAITEISVQEGVMRRDNAAALVGAGLLTVMVFPLLAKALGGRAGAEEPVPDPVAAGE